VHYWIGRIQEGQKNTAAARGEYETSLKLSPKYKIAEEALKRLGKK
jgi:TolA-binding protein